MAGKFEITKAGDTFSFELFIDDKAVGKSPVFDKEDACKRGVKAVKKNSRMKVQNTLANDEEKTNPKYLVEADGEKVKYTLFLQTGAVALEGSADSEAEVLDIIEKSEIMQTPHQWQWQRLFFPKMSKSKSELISFWHFKKQVKTRLKLHLQAKPTIQTKSKQVLMNLKEKMLSLPAEL